MNKKSNQPDDAATADTLPPAAPEDTKGVGDSIVVDDSAEGLDRMREFGLTVTADIHPGVIVTFDHPTRLRNGDEITRTAPGKYEWKRAEPRHA